MIDIMTPSTEQIIGDVACVVGVPAAHVASRRHTVAAQWARFLSIAAIRKAYPFQSLKDLAMAVGRKDHGTAIHALKRFDHLVKTSPDFRALASDLQLI